MKILRMTGGTLEFYKAEYRSLEAGHVGSSPKLYDFKNSLKLFMPPFPKL